MPIVLPLLEEGRIYHRAEVEQYIGKQGGSSDYDVMAIHFPRSLDGMDCDLEFYRPDEVVLLQYRVFPLSELASQIRGLELLFESHNAHRERVETIKRLLANGSAVYPLFIQQNDPKRRIVEGMHRAVAMLQLGSPCVPAFLTGYRDWFADSS